MRQTIIAGNWKMNKTLAEGTALVTELIHILADETRGTARVVLCVPSVYLVPFHKMLEGTPNVSLGGQNLHAAASGAYTGELSAAMLSSVGARYVIIGHSERRQHFREASEGLARKVDSALAHGLTPIFCCGESLEQRNDGDYVAIVCAQLTEALFHLDAAQVARVVIAYEPIWAIGTGVTATTEQAQAMHAALRQHLASQYGPAVADDITIQYGGSMNAANAAELLACPDVDGGLVGGASLKARDFVEIIKAAG